MWKLNPDGSLVGSFTIAGSTLPAGAGFRDMEYANGFLGAVLIATSFIKST